MKHSFFHSLYRIIFCCVLLVSLRAMSHGFPFGTVIATEHGFIPIEQLSTGTQVIGWNHAKNGNRLPSVSAIGLWRPESLIRISYGTQSEVISSPDQQFYCVNKDQWIHAYELCVGDQLATADGNSVTIEAIEVLPASGPTIIVSVEPDHVFSCTPGKLLTHNVVVVIPIVTYVFGEGAVWFGGATAATILVAVAKYVVYTIAEKMGCDVHDTSVTIADHSYVPESATPHHAGVISAHSSSPYAVSPFDIPHYEASFSAPVTIEQTRSANRAPQPHSYQPESDIAAYLKTQPRPVQGSAPCGEPDMPAWIPPQLPVTNGISEDQLVRTCGTAALAQPKEPRACGSANVDVPSSTLNDKGRDNSFQEAVERGKEALQKQLRGCNFWKQRSCSSFTQPAATSIGVCDDADTTIEGDTQPDSEPEAEEASLVLRESDTDSYLERSEHSDSADREQILCGGPASTAQQGGITTPLPLSTIDIAADADGAHVKIEDIDKESAEYKLQFEKALEYASIKNNLKHYFELKHLFGELFDVPKSDVTSGKENITILIQKEFIKRVLKELLKSANLPSEGDLKEVLIVLDGIPIKSVVVMHEGTIKIGNMYVAAELLPKKILDSLPATLIDQLPKRIKKIIKEEIKT